MDLILRCSVLLRQCIRCSKGSLRHMGSMLTTTGLSIRQSQVNSTLAVLVMKVGLTFLDLLWFNHIEVSFIETHSNV